MVDMARYSVVWRNPFTAPTGPRVLGAMLVPYGERCPEELAALHVPGSGYCISWELVSQKPIRRWSAEAKGRARLRNLRRRIEKKFPLFAGDFITQELEKRPGYYAGEDVNA